MTTFSPPDAFVVALSAASGFKSPPRSAAGLGPLLVRELLLRDHIDRDYEAMLKAAYEKLCDERAGQVIGKPGHELSGYANADFIKSYRVRMSCGHIELRPMRTATAGIDWSPTHEPIVARALCENCCPNKLRERKEALEKAKLANAHHD